FATRTLAIGALAATSAMALALGAAGAQDQPQAGVAAAVVSPVELSRASAGSPLAVESGTDIFLEDRIVTGDGSRMQVLLLDETTLTIGPNSDLVIDRFVYDPDSGTGEIAAEMATGFLRYLSGKVAEETPENVRINTPAASMGIRGSALFVAQSPDDPDTYFCGVLGPGLDNNAFARRGACLIENEQGSTEVRRAGFGAFVTKGEAPRDPIPFPEQLLEDLHIALRPGVGARGAARAAAPSGGVGVGAGGESAAQTTGQRTAELRESGVLAESILTNRFDELTVNNDSNIVDPLPPITPDPTIVVPAFAQLTSNDVFDLDLHATGPNPSGSGRFHVFFANTTGPVGEGGVPAVELDDVPGFPGSEVLTLNSFGEGGVTRISVFNFSDQTFGSTSLANLSDAMVSLLRNGLIERGPGGSMVITGDLIDQISPAPGGAGNTFVAYEINPDGTFTAVGEFTEFPNSFAVE
ncbi:MAG: FecR family protein, partial [Pseudomonadota bacterium]